MPKLIFKCTGVVKKWTIAPNVPRDVVFNENTGVMYGTAREVMALKVYTVTAVSEESTSSNTFEMELKPCEHGNFLLSRSHVFDESAIKISYEGKTVFEQKSIKGGDFIMSACIPVNDYDYEYTCISTANTCDFLIVNENGRTYVGITAVAKESVTGKLYVKTCPALVITMDPELYVAKTINFEYKVNIEGVYDTLKFDKELIDMTFSPITRILTGHIPTPGIFAYTIIGTNSVGTVSVPFTVYVNRCKGSSTLLQLSRNSNNRDDSLRVEDMNGKVITEDILGLYIYRKNFCFDTTEVKLFMMTKSPSGMWSEEGELLALDSNEELIGYYRLNNGKGLQEERITFGSTVARGSSIRMSRSIASSWTQLKFKDNSWAEKKIGEWGSFSDSQKTVYFRKQFSVDNANKYVEMIVDLLMVDGAVVYLNGAEVIRRNMAEGTVSPDTLATLSYPSPNYYRATIPIASLVTGKNILAIELHRSSTAVSTEVILFDVRLQMVSSGCTLRNGVGIASDNQGGSATTHKPSEAFDSNVYTYWEGSIFPAELKYMFSNNVMTYVNEVEIRSNIAFDTNQLADFDIVGITADNSEVIVATVNSKTLFNGPYAVATIKLSTSRAFAGYALKIRGTNAGSVVDVAYIRFYTCMHRQCKKFRWPTAELGQTSRGRCPFMQKGVNQMKCVRNVDTAVWDTVNSTACVRTFPPSGYATIDMKYQMVNCTIIQWNNKVKDALRQVFMEYLAIKKNEISFVDVVDMSDTSLFRLEVAVRFLMENEVGDYVLKYTKPMNLNVTALLRTKLGKDCNGINVVVMGKPSFHGQANVYVVVIIILVVVIAVMALLMLLYVWRQNTTTKSKSLKRKSLSKSGDKESLLTDV